MQRPGWPELRAGLVAAHLVALSLLGLPEPQLDDQDLGEVHVQQWFDQATATLHALGASIPRETVFEEGVRLGRQWLAVREVLVWPGRTYARFAGTGQSWRMFASVPNESSVLFVEVQRAGRWEPVHWMRFREPRWREAFWDQERIRAMCNQFTHKKNRGAWTRLGRLLTPWLRQDFPEATRLRMGMQRVAFPPPGVLVATGDLEWGERFWVTELGKAP